MDPGTVFALGAALYSSVGHGGASAYIAAMALFSVAPESMKPTALALNLLVAGFGAWRYWSRDLTNWKLVFAFAVTASPAAFVGGGIHLPAIYYKALVGILLWLSAVRLLWQPTILADRAVHGPSYSISLPAGAVLGLLAGLTGTGGGIFLSRSSSSMHGRSRDTRRALSPPSSFSTLQLAWPAMQRPSGNCRMNCRSFSPRCSRRLLRT